MRRQFNLTRNYFTDFLSKPKQTWTSTTTNFTFQLWITSRKFRKVSFVLLVSVLTKTLRLWSNQLAVHAFRVCPTDVGPISKAHWKHSLLVGFILSRRKWFTTVIIANNLVIFKVFIHICSCWWIKFEMNSFIHLFVFYIYLSSVKKFPSYKAKETQSSINHHS